MPYGVFKNSNGKYGVYKTDNEGRRTGDALGEHDSEEKAEAQIRGIGANSHKSMGVYDAMRYDQLTVQYAVPPADATKLCGSCRFYKYEGCCHIVQAEPRLIVSAGGCNQWNERPAHSDTGQELLQVFTDISNSLRNVDARASKASLLQQFSEAIQRAIGIQPAVSQVNGYKRDGDRFLGWWTNNFQDREREIIAMKALNTYVEAVKSGRMKYPELWWMHIPGTAHGQTDGLVSIGHFVLATGKYFPVENAFQEAVMKWYDKMDTDGVTPTMSHQFYYNPKLMVKGTYWDMSTFEISTLVPNTEANKYTSYTTIERLERMLST